MTEILLTWRKAKQPNSFPNTYCTKEDNADKIFVTADDFVL